MHSAFITALVSLGGVLYLIVFLGMIFEGDVFLFTSFFLVHAKIVRLAPAVAAIFLGAIVGDILWYWMGRERPRLSFLPRWIQKVSTHACAPFDEHIKHRLFHSVFISKFTYGIHHLLIVRVGMLKIRFKRFFKIDLPATLLWMLIVGGLGYVAGASFDLLRRRIHVFELLLLLAVLAFIIAGEAISKLLRKFL